MKNILKFCVIIVCMGIMLYSAEKFNPDTIIQEALEKGTPIDRATMKKIREHHKMILAQEDIECTITLGRYIPRTIIEQVDQVTAARALQHNQKLQLKQIQELK